MPGISWARAADASLVVGCATVGVALVAAAQASAAQPQRPAALAVDLGFGGVACLLLWWRRDRPVMVALLTAACDLVSFAGTPAYLVAVFAVAVRRPPRLAAAVAAAHLVAVVVGAALAPSGGDPLWRVAVASALVLALVAATGLYVGARRDLVVSLRDRAERLEAERERDLAAARVVERARIAAEIHDVLAHRISLISLHAGGLQIRTAGGDPRTAEAAALIGDTARSAMGDLRDVVGLLREPGDGYGRDRPAPPQPTLDRLAELVESSRRAGLPVELRLEVAAADVRECPAAAGRHVYRVVQESLTNVHKHTARAPTTVRVAGARGGLLSVEVSNRLESPEVVDRDVLPGSGSGLVGLHERITRAGGTFSSGRVQGPGGEQFVVRAEVAWP